MEIHHCRRSELHYALGRYFGKKEDYNAVKKYHRDIESLDEH